MRQLGHGGGKAAGHPQFAGHEIQGIGQLRRGEHFLLDRLQQILRRRALVHPLANRAEEVGLLDIFFARQWHRRKGSGGVC